jgi:Chemotaxis phosphatase CheX
MNELAMQLGDIVQSTTEAFLACPASPCDPPSEALVEVLSEVTIAGGWSGRVIVGCDRAAARAFTSVMFGSPSEVVSDAEIADALAELANIVGGNFKSLVATQRCSLSLPHAAEDLVGPCLLDRWYAVGGGWIHVRVAQRDMQ